jgi:glycosyltransferase involved in cell wall biosynthesis
MKILFVCGREPQYSRNRVILSALKKNFEIIECTSTLKFTPLRYLSIFFKFLKNKHKADKIFIGFLGQPLVLLARLFSKKEIIFDAFISIYQTLVEDYRSTSNKILAKVYKFLDRKSCELASKIILDTNQHINYFVNEFNLDKNKFYKIPVGTDESIFYPQKNKSKEFTVEFHGHFIPLQGTIYIAEAINILKRENIKFVITGKGKDYKEFKKYCDNNDLNKLMDYKEKVSYNELPNLISKADVCLGIFGNTRKTSLVIPNKVYESIAMQQPIITSNTKASSELLKNNFNAILCKQADSKDLADSILLLKNNKKLRDKIAKNSFDTFREKASLNFIQSELKKLF